MPPKGRDTRFRARTLAWFEDGDEFEKEEAAPFGNVAADPEAADLRPATSVWLKRLSLIIAPIVVVVLVVWLLS